MIHRRINMGYNFGVVYANRSSESSRILNFHSTAKWNAHFEAMKKTDKLLHGVDLANSWIQLSKNFAGKYTDVEFVKLDVDELMEVSQEFQVQTMPTFLLIKKGKVSGKVVGVRKEELQRLIEKHRK